MPTPTGKHERRAPRYLKQVREAENLVGYSLVAATVAAGVALAVVFSAI